MADFWSKGLRGDVGATPRLNRAVGQKPGIYGDKPGPTPAREDKGKADKNLTPLMAGIVSGCEGLAQPAQLLPPVDMELLTAPVTPCCFRARSVRRTQQCVKCRRLTPRTRTRTCDRTRPRRRQASSAAMETKATTSKTIPCGCVSRVATSRLQTPLEDPCLPCFGLQVFVRVRPATSQELTHGKPRCVSVLPGVGSHTAVDICPQSECPADKHEQCLSVIGSRSIQLNMKEKQNTTHSFHFDQVLPETTTQQDVFDCELVGEAVAATWSGISRWLAGNGAGAAVGLLSAGGGSA